MNITINRVLTGIVCAIIFMIFALYNGYPIVMFGDTSTYLKSAFELNVPAERPIFYGLFIRLTSWGASIWLTIFIQCLILAYIVIRFIRYVLPDITQLRLIAIVAVIALATISSWYAGQVMPDIFSPVLFMAMFLYLLARNSTGESILLLFIILLSTVVHNSHYVIATIFVVGLLLAGLLNKSRWAHFRKKSLHLLAVVILSWCSLFMSNIIAGNGFTTARAQHVFLMGKLAESGVLKTYLDASCPVKNYDICAYKEEIPPVAWEFVWDVEHSPVFKAGGWDSTKEEYNTIIKDIVSRPKYWPFLLYKSVEATFRQVILLNIDEAEELPWRRIEKGDPMYNVIYKYFPHEVNEFMVTRQNQKTLNIPFYDGVYVIVLLVTSFIVMMFIEQKYKADAQLIYGLLIYFLLLNAAATATFGNVLSRLNSRAIWLLPMVNILWIYRYASAQVTEKKNR